MEHLNLFHSQEIIEMSGQGDDQPLVRGEESREGCELKQYFIFRFNLNPLYYVKIRSVWSLSLR